MYTVGYSIDIMKHTLARSRRHLKLSLKQRIIIQWKMSRIRPLILLPLCTYLVMFFTQPIFAVYAPTRDVETVEKKVDVVREVEVYKPSTEGLINYYAQEYKINADELRCILKNESGFRKAATNGTSSASGMGQFINSTWISWRKEMGENPDLNLRFDADEMIKTTSFGLSKGRQSHWEAWNIHCQQFKKE